jgi:diguanylate cyclase (GGDEF)-like protein
MDFDKFGDINTHYGHAVGDLVLKAVAERLEFCVRTNDTVARLGGDEFVVLLTSIEDQA